MPLSSDFPLVQIMVKKKKNEQNFSDIPVSSILLTDFPLSNIGAVLLFLYFDFVSIFHHIIWIFYNIKICKIWVGFLQRSLMILLILCSFGFPISLSSCDFKTYRYRYLLTVYKWSESPSLRAFAVITSTHGPGIILRMKYLLISSLRLQILTIFFVPPTLLLLRKIP